MNDEVFAAAYRAGHERIVAFLDGRDTDTVVPACPAWTAADVVRHLAGVSGDITDGVFDGLASDAWTEAQVAARRDLSYPQVLAEWSESIDMACELLAHVSDIDGPSEFDTAFGRVPIAIVPSVAVSDILHHEYDIRNAFGDRGSRDLMETHFAAAGHVRGLRGVFAVKRLPSMRVVIEETGQTFDVGREEPVATVTAPAFELLRGIGGRRTREEMLGWEWDGDPAPFVDAMLLPHFTMRTDSLGET